MESSKPKFLWNFFIHSIESSHEHSLSSSQAFNNHAGQLLTDLQILRNNTITWYLGWVVTPVLSTCPTQIHFHPFLTDKWASAPPAAIVNMSCSNLKTSKNEPCGSLSTSSRSRSNAGLWNNLLSRTVCSLPLNFLLVKKKKIGCILNSSASSPRGECNRRAERWKAWIDPENPTPILISASQTSLERKCRSTEPLARWKTDISGPFSY